MIRPPAMKRLPLLALAAAPARAEDPATGKTISPCKQPVDFL